MHDTITVDDPDKYTTYVLDVSYGTNGDGGVESINAKLLHGFHAPFGRRMIFRPETKQDAAMEGGLLLKRYWTEVVEEVQTRVNRRRGRSYV